MEESRQQRIVNRLLLLLSAQLLCLLWLSNAGFGDSLPQRILLALILASTPLLVAQLLQLRTLPGIVLGTLLGLLIAADIVILAARHFGHPLPGTQSIVF